MMDTVVETDPTGRFARSSEVLGKGSSKTVYKAFDSIEGREVAWNQALLTSGSMEAAHGLLHTEVKVLKSLKHRNIMNFYASWVDDEQGTLNFITEYFHSGTLKRHRLAHRSLQLNLQLLKRWSWQILQGLVYLHGHNPPVIHRDLKCDNIFIHGVTGEVKIGDLGLARLMEENFSMCHTCIGTPEFMAPELYKEEYNEKVDIYSFGMCILELVTMAYPYSECKTACQIYRHVTEGIPPQSLAKITDEETRNFIELCIRYEHDGRPSARQLVKHKFFDDVRVPPPNSKLHYVPSCPELALDDEDQPPNIDVSEDAERPMLHHFSAPECRPNLCSESAGTSLDEVDSGCGLGSLFAEEISDVEEGCKQFGSPKGSKDDASSTGRGGEESSVLDTKRQFSIQHRVSPVLPFVDVVNFELCLGGPGSCKRLLFSFDVVSDTVEDVGLELEEEFQLTPEETDQFTAMLKQELERALGSHPRDSTDVHTFGSVLVSMSLDDWTAQNEESGSVKGPHSTEQSMTRLSFKINVEKSMSAHSSRNVGPETVKKKKSPEIEATKRRRSMERNLKGARKSFNFERPGSMWNNLVHHLRGGAVSLCHHSNNHKLYRFGRLCGDARALSNDDSVVPSTCTDASLHGEQPAGTQTDAQQAPLVKQKLKRRNSGLICARSLSPVLNQVRSVAGAVRHLKEAAVILCRNSLEGKKIFFEIKGRGANKVKAASADRETMQTSDAVDDSARCVEAPESVVGFKGCTGCLYPSIRNGSCICRPLRRIAKRASRPWLKTQSCS